MWIDLLKVLETSIGSIIVLFLLAHLMGNKQISQLSMFDYIVGISIGSIAAEMATELEAPLHSLVAMIVYGLMAFLISIATSKSLKLRRFVTGKPILLMDQGRIYRDNLKRARLDLTDFLTLCRVSGYFDLAAIKTAVMECNGTLSFLPVSALRAAQPADFELYPKQELLFENVIMDGVLMRGNLQATGFDELWLRAQLKLRGYSSYRQILLATCDTEGTLAVYPMDAKAPANWNPFE